MMKPTHRFLAVLPFLLTAGGCAQRIPEPVLKPHDVPHISWTIHVADQPGGRETTICSSDPRTECVVPASTEGRKVFAMVHLFFHPAAAETRYTGSVQIGFFGGPAESHEMKPNVIVQPKDSPARHSMSDFVTTRPGKYQMLVALVATSVPNGEGQSIRDEVAVLVK